MVAKCPACEQMHRITHLKVMELHYNREGTDACPGCGSEPERHTILAERSKTLPGWVTKAIASHAYEHAHSGGYEEVALVEQGMISHFEEYFEEYLISRARGG